MKSPPKNNIYDHISLQIKTLHLCGIWFYIPHPVNSYKFWLDIIWKVFIGITAFFIPPLGQGICAVKLMLSGHAEVQEIAGIINLVLTELLISFKLLDLRSRRDLLNQLKKQMKCEDFFYLDGPQKDIMERSIRLSKKLFIWLSVISALDISVHVVVVPAIHKFKVLPVKMDFIFFDILESPFFIYIVIYQILYKPVLLLAFVSLQTMRWAFMLCTISQFDILIHNLENMKEIKNTGNGEQVSLERAFKKNILHHCAIIKFVNKIEETFGGQFILYFIINSCIICTTAIEFVSIKNPSDHIMDMFWIFGFLFIMIVILFIDCYFGSTITQKNSYLSTVVYCYPWINLNVNLKKNFIIFIGQNQRTLAIHAAKVIPVSMATFTKIINWTYKCFAVLNQMKK